MNSYRSTYNSSGGVRGETKPLNVSTRCQVWCPAVKKPASSQQAPGRLHVETWAGRNCSPSLLISQAVEIGPVCAGMVVCLLPPFFASVSPGPGREVTNGMGWTLFEETARSGVWGVPEWLGRVQCALFACAATGDWVRKGSFLTAWAAPPLSSCSCSYAGTAVGPQSGRRCWSLLTGLWCAEGEVPTAANLNLYRGTDFACRMAQRL